MSKRKWWHNSTYPETADDVRLVADAWRAGGLVEEAAFLGRCAALGRASHNAGFDEGYKEGHTAGYDKGYDAGYAEGYEKGREKGHEEGEERG